MATQIDVLAARAARPAASEPAAAVRPARPATVTAPAAGAATALVVREDAPVIPSHLKVVRLEPSRASSAAPAVPTATPIQEPSAEALASLSAGGKPSPATRRTHSSGPGPSPGSRGHARSSSSPMPAPPARTPGRRSSTRPAGAGMPEIPTDPARTSPARWPSTRPRDPCPTRSRGSPPASFAGGAPPRQAASRPVSPRISPIHPPESAPASTHRRCKEPRHDKLEDRSPHRRTAVPGPLADEGARPGPRHAGRPGRRCGAHHRDHRRRAGRAAAGECPGHRRPERRCRPPRGGLGRGRSGLRGRPRRAARPAKTT